MSHSQRFLSVISYAGRRTWLTAIAVRSTQRYTEATAHKETRMNVGIFALILQLIGLVLVIYGWQDEIPVLFVGVALIVLGIVLRWTRHRGHRR